MKLIYNTPRGIGTIIYADFKSRTVQIENHTDTLLDRAFGINEHPTWEDFEFFLEDRCFPKTRDKMKLILEDMGLDYYDPLAIIRKTHGRMAEDHAWIDIENDSREDSDYDKSDRD